MMVSGFNPIFKQCITFTAPVNVIIANGEAPPDKAVLQSLGRIDNILCCDGAINILELWGVEADYIIGDCDSLTPTQKQRYADKIKYFPDQNTNDLTKAVNFAVNILGLDNIIILGATGLREDHSLANISLLVEYSQQVKKIILLSVYGVFSVHSGLSVISSAPGQQISLFAVNSAVATTSGLKWDLNNLVLDSWYKGSLNQALSDTFKLETKEPILVYRAFEIKD